jgi:hypothetical protein
MTFKQWQRGCACGFKGLVFGWDYQMPLPCPSCGAATHDATDRPHGTLMIATDDIPGGMLVPHAICNDDGTPKRYYSKSEIREAARQKGWTISGETPKPAGSRWL